MQQFKGTYYFAGSSACCVAFLQQGKQLQIKAADTDELLWQGNHYQTGIDLPGLAVEVQFDDGSYFVPDDVTLRLNAKGRVALATRLEQHKVAILLSVLLVPLTLWWLITAGLPKFAAALVPHLPEAVSETIDSQSMVMLDKTMLDASALPEQQQQQLRQQWLAALAQLPQAKKINANIQFRQAKGMGANAFALPAGTIVFTDELVTLLEKNPDALLAVFLHEVGHVQHQHGLKLLAQSTATTMLLALLFNDLEGLSEVLLGSGSSLIQAAFSREMESEADLFATTSLLQLGKSGEAFADAMTAISQQSGAASMEKWTQYLSSHPLSAERIEQAKKQQAVPTK
jgi:Zn-dependent protease with chaperone function